MTALSLPQPGESPTQALARLGLAVADFTEMMWAGHVASRSVTAHDPRNASGLSRYIRMTGTLRGRLAGRGWASEDPRGLATISDPASDVTLIVCSGNALAGSIDPKQLPRTRYRKGPMYRAAILKNRQLMLGAPDEEDPAEVPGRQTWLALWHATAVEGRIEISLPAAVDDDNFVSTWAHRIILDPIALGDLAPLDDGDEPDDGIDITVEPR